MGIFDIFNRKELKNEANGPVKKAKDIGDKVIKQQLYRFNQELKNWKLGVDNFEDNFSPTTVELIRVYNDIVIDAHLSAAMDARISKTTSKDFKIVDEDGEELKDESYYFSAPWFRNFLKLSLESKFFGYSLIQFNDLKGYCFKSTEVFPREYVYPQKGSVRTSPFSTEGLISYEASPYDAWTLGVGNPSDIGLLMKAAPLVIFKKTALGSWTEFAELFGAPFRLGKTDVRDEELRDNMYNMLENMGRNAYGVFDKDDELEFIRDNKSDAYNVFNELIERTNSELSKLILGSTMTMDDGSSRSQSEVHERTSGAINKEDAFFIQSVVNDELIPWLNKYHDFNITGRWVFDDTENTSKAEQFKIDSELVKMGFNVPKEYFTETYSTPINDKEEEPETDPGPETEPTEDNEAGDIENALKKKTTLATIYDAFTSGIDGHECTNELDYEETPPPEWSDAFIDDVVRGVYSGAYTTKKLPESLYLELGERLTNGLYEGLATGDALTTIANPEYIKNLRNNIYTFSGAKNWQQVNLMSEFLLDADGNKRSFKQYKDFARQTFGTFNVNYLKTEINHAKGSAQMAEKWQQIDEEADIFPFLRYVTAGDERVRPAHQALNGVIKRVDSDFWKENSPLNGWNCRCSLQQVEEGIETPDAEIKEKVNELTDGAGLQTPDYMKNNPGREIFGKQHPYFKVPRGFKADKANNFGLPDPPPITNEEIVKNIKTAQRKIDKKAVVFNKSQFKTTIKDINTEPLEDLINNQDGAGKIFNDYGTDFGIRSPSDRTGKGAEAWFFETRPKYLTKLQNGVAGTCATDNSFLNILVKKGENFNFEVVNMVQKAEDLVKKYPKKYFIYKNEFIKGSPQKGGAVYGIVKPDGFIKFQGITEASSLFSKSVAPTTTHEINHLIHNTVDKKIKGKRLKTIAAAKKYGITLDDSVTGYGSLNWSEFYAENMALYVHSNKYLKTKHKKVFGFLEELNKEFKIDLKTFKIAK